jgi:serine/threonine protein kinase
MAETDSDLESGVVTKDGLRVDVVTGKIDSVYDVGKPIGKGKFSTVYKAIRKADNIPVALKKVAIFDIMEEKSREKCLKEIRLVQSLNHDNIIRYYDGFIENKELILVFEYAGTTRIVK